MLSDNTASGDLPQPLLPMNNTDGINATETVAEERFAGMEVEPSLELDLIAGPVIKPLAEKKQQGDPLRAPQELDGRSSHNRGGKTVAEATAEMDMNEICNPLEDEAENAIIRAMETRQWEHPVEEDLQFLKAIDTASDDQSFDGGVESATGPTRGRPAMTKLRDLSTRLKMIESTGKSMYFSRRQLGKDAMAQLESERAPTNKNTMGDADDYDVEAQYMSNESINSHRSQHSRHSPKTVKIVSDAVEMGDNSVATKKTESRTSTTRRSIRDEMNGGRNSTTKTKRLIKNSKEMVKELHWSLKFKWFVKFVTILIVLPCLFVSAVLFYLAGNPIAGAPPVVTSEDTSYSWWLLFIVRQVIILCLAKITEIVIIEIMTLRFWTFQRRLGSFGSFVALALIQSRGWPYVITLWAILDFCFLQGNTVFAKHWLFYLYFDWFTMCKYVEDEYVMDGMGSMQRTMILEGSVTDCNPAGNVVSSELYKRVLIGMIVLGCTATLKRVLFGIYVGKKAAETYTPDLEKLMAKMVLIGEVAQLAKEIWQDYKNRSTMSFGGHMNGEHNMVGDDDASAASDDEGTSGNLSGPLSGPITNPETISPLLGKTRDGANVGGAEIPFGDPKIIDHGQAALSKLTKQKLSELVGAWDEPVEKKTKIKSFSVADVLEFRRAVYGLDKRHPFSYAFGPADSREACLESAKKVYGRLLLDTPYESKLPFETLSLIALSANGDLDENKVRQLIRMFRPNRSGEVAALSFVKSCDKVYKQLRTLRAAIINSSQIDYAFEKIFNIFFYLAMTLVLLAIVRVDPWPLIASSSAFILGFSFMFSKAASKYFDGILLILLQKPFDIGDRIHLSDPKNETSSNGSLSWFVEEVTLHSTTLRYAVTNEVATFANGVLADLRIINANRSPKAICYVYIKFGSDVPFEKVMLFRSAIESFVKERPSQWVCMNSFRSTRFEADLGYIEYLIMLTHVEKWQNALTIYTSQAELSSYCLEVQKRLGVRYEAPPLPVNLGMVGSRAGKTEMSQLNEKPEDISQSDFDKLANLFTESEMKKRR